MEIEKNPQDDGEVTSDTFDRDDEDTEETEDAPTETDAGANEEDDTIMKRVRRVTRRRKCS